MNHQSISYYQIMRSSGAFAPVKIKKKNSRLAATPKISVILDPLYVAEVR